MPEFDIRDFEDAVRLIPEIESKLVSVSFTERQAGIELSSIWSEVERGKGHAGRAMRAIIELADERGIDLLAQPHALAYDTANHWGDDGYSTDEIDLMDALNAQRLDSEQLLAWYLRLGFETTGKFIGDDPEIVRRAMAPAPTP